MEHHISRSNIAKSFETTLRIDRLREIGELSQYIKSIHRKRKSPI